MIDIGVPPFDKAKATYLRLALTETLQLVKDKIATIASNPEKPTWENTFEALERGDTGSTIPLLPFWNARFFWGFMAC